MKRRIPLTVKEMKAFCDDFGLTTHRKIKGRDKMEEFFWNSCVEPQLKRRPQEVSKRSRSKSKKSKSSAKSSAKVVVEKRKSSFTKDTSKLNSYASLLKYLKAEGHKVKSVLDLVSLSAREVNTLIKKTQKYNDIISLEEMIAKKTTRLRSKEKIREVKTQLLLEALANNMCRGIKAIQAKQKLPENRAIAIIRSTMFNKRGYKISNFKCKGTQPLLLPKKGDVIVLGKQI